MPLQQIWSQAVSQSPSAQLLQQHKSFLELETEEDTGNEGPTSSVEINEAAVSQLVMQTLAAVLFQLQLDKSHSFALWAARAMWLVQVSELSPSGQRQPLLSDLVASLQWHFHIIALIITGKFPSDITKMKSVILWKILLERQSNGRLASQRGNYIVL